MQGNELGWPAWTYGMMLGSLPVFALFGWYESRRLRAGKSPLVVTSLFRRRSYTSSLIVGLIFFAGISGMMLVLALYLQMGLGYSPLKAALTSVPQSIGITIGAIVGGNLAAKFGRTVLQIGGAIMALAGGAFFATLQIVGDSIGPWHLAPTLLVMGIGMGLVFAPYFDIALGGVEEHETGSASGTLTAVQQVGNAAGAAALGTLFFSGLDLSGQARPDFTGAAKVVMLAEIAILIVSLGLMFLLPKRAREGHGH